VNTPIFSSAPKEICIIRLSAIGDITHMLPIIATLKKEWPSTEITWVIGAIEYQLIKQVEDINFIIFNKNNGFKEYLTLRKTLKNKCFDALLMMQTSLRASMISLCIKAKIRLGFDQLRAHDSQSLFTNHTIDNTPNLHVLDVLFLFLKKLGIQNRHFDWLLKSSSDDKEFALNASQQKPYVLINPSSSIRKNNYRNWPTEYYAEIIDHLMIVKNMNVIISGGPSLQEIDLGKDIIKLCKSSPKNLIAKTSLMQLLALIEQAQCLVAPDTGPAHMGTITDTPVIALFASSNPLRTGPYKSQKQLINAYPTALKSYSEKTIEHTKWGERVRHPNVMSLITIQHLKDKLNDVVKTI